MKNSVTLGVGQFCTCPGLTIGIDDEGFARFASRLEMLIENAQPGTMLYPAIFQSYEAGVHRLSAIEEVRAIRSSIGAGVKESEARPSMLETNAQNFMFVIVMSAALAAIAFRRLRPDEAWVHLRRILSFPT